MLWIGGNALQGFGGRLEQQPVHLSFVLQGKCGQWFRQSEDDMKILTGQQLGSPLFQPLGARQRLTLWAMSIGTGVVGIAFVPTSITSLQMTSNCGGATGFDGAQRPLLRGGQRGSMRLAKLVAVCTHDVRDFQCRPHGIELAMLSGPGWEAGADLKGW